MWTSQLIKPGNPLSSLPPDVVSLCQLWTQPSVLTTDTSGACSGSSAAVVRPLQVNKSCESRGGFQCILVVAGGYSTAGDNKACFSWRADSDWYFLCYLQRCLSTETPSRLIVSVAAFTATLNSLFPPHCDSDAVWTPLPSVRIRLFNRPVSFSVLIGQSCLQSYCCWIYYLPPQSPHLFHRCLVAFLLIWVQLPFPFLLPVGLVFLMSHMSNGFLPSPGVDCCFLFSSLSSSQLWSVQLLAWNSVD